jgi:glycosyltransferase involved in cell wall biosynthesis
MKILVTGNYDPTYNRTQILLKGLRNHPEVELLEYPIVSIKRIDKIKFKELAATADFIYLPPFTHESVKKIKNLTDKPLIFDPLISKYLTKVFDYQQVSRYSPRAYKNYLKDKLPLQKANLIIADTNEHKKYFAKTFKIPLDKIKVLPIGADVIQFHPKAITSNNTFKIGFYGGFIPLQGVTHIIETAEILKNEKDIEFHLIGTGFELEKIKNLVKKLQLKNVNFSGWIEYDKLPDAINDFDICLGIFGDTPKADLVIPNKIYHYAALKKCIITKETLAIKEVFTNQKNIILSSNSPKDIATQILTLKKNSSLTSSIADGAFKLINDSYDSNKIADQFISILKNFKQH